MFGGFGFCIGFELISGGGGGGWCDLVDRRWWWVALLVCSAVAYIILLFSYIILMDYNPYLKMDIPDNTLPFVHCALPEN